MAAETPFGTSFDNYGDPRRYMNKGESPGKKVEQFVAKIKNSPLANLAGIMLAGGGEPLSSPVPAPALGQGISAPAIPPIGLNPSLANRSGEGIAPGSFQMPELFKKPYLTLPQIGTATPTQETDADGDGQVDSFWGIKANTPPSPQSSAAPFVSQPIADVTNKTDFNPLAPDTSNQFAVSGNDYQQIPGFGSAQDKAGKLMKLMGMG